MLGFLSVEIEFKKRNSELLEAHVFSQLWKVHASDVTTSSVAYMYQRLSSME